MLLATYRLMSLRSNSQYKSGHKCVGVDEPMTTCYRSLADGNGQFPLYRTKLIGETRHIESNKTIEGVSDASS